MFRRLLHPGVLSLVASIALLLIPNVSQAQRGGGYSVGRGGVGSYYGGSPYYGNWGYGNRPYYSGSYYPGNYGYQSGYYPRTYYGGYYYPNNSYYNNSYYNNGSYVSTPNTSSYQSFYPSEGVTGASYANAPDQSSRAVTMSIRVPTDAEVWFGDVKTNLTGTERVFVSPALEPGNDYTYDIRARWNENGRSVERTRTLRVHAGDRLSINFLNN